MFNAAREVSHGRGRATAAAAAGAGWLPLRGSRTAPCNQTFRARGSLGSKDENGAYQAAGPFSVPSPAKTACASEVERPRATGHETGGLSVADAAAEAAARRSCGGGDGGSEAGEER
eukprot:357949-Chlamydomonas_euryale.AAC.3